MSDFSPPELSAELRERTLARFEDHRRAWQANPALRTCYGHWYGKLRAALPPSHLGPWIEIGSGPGFAREFIPELELTDVVQAPWHARRMSAEALALGDRSVGALLLFDVLHHVAAPATFFAEAARVLRPGGRILLCEPYISPVSRWVYRRFHSEPVDMSVDPLAAEVQDAAIDKDPFASNQAIPTLVFCRDKGRIFESMFPQLGVLGVECLAGLAYPASGGFSHAPFLPAPLWRGLFAFENLLPEIAFRGFGFRMIVVIERRPSL
ncbi:MAG TPA: class I SAM-dependent methyltransferase [Polyangia bacterium]